MESSWTPDERLRIRVDEVLHYLWDPIGISDVPAARDEYYTYSAQAFGMLKNGATTTEIAANLRRIRVERMEIGRSPELISEDEIADLLVRWKEEIIGEAT